jgi:hypothetical protein
MDCGFDHSFCHHGWGYSIIGASQRTATAKLLRGSVATNVAQHLPESIQLLIFG